MRTWELGTLFFKRFQVRAFNLNMGKSRATPTQTTHSIVYTLSQCLSSSNNVQFVLC